MKRYERLDVICVASWNDQVCKDIANQQGNANLLIQKEKNKDEEFEDIELPGVLKKQHAEFPGVD